MSIIPAASRLSAAGGLGALTRAGFTPFLPASGVPNDQRRRAARSERRRGQLLRRAVAGFMDLPSAVHRGSRP